MDALGEAVVRVGSFGRRSAMGIRMITLVPSGAVAILAADSSAMRRFVVVAFVVLCVWSVVYAAQMRRGVTVWVTVVDAVLLGCLGAITTQMTPASWLMSNKTWLRPFTTFAAVAYQYSAPSRVGVPAGLAICTTVAIANSAAQHGPPGLDTVITAVWSNAVVLLARLLWTLLTRAAIRADVAFTEAEIARRRQLVAESVRADERLITDSLHDTAATTLLIVAVGQASGLGEVLRHRARHDLQTLRAMRAGPLAAPTDLSQELLVMTQRSAVTVSLSGPDQLDLPPDVARALADAAGEALTNVARHAGSLLAHIQFGIDDGTVFVEITDDGRGFDIALVPATRRGLRASVTDRMAAVGGASRIKSAVGMGTTVRLEWPA